jgi:hypothetical protein
MRVMRKPFRVLLLAAIVAAFVVPVGFALSLESEPVAPTRHAPASERAAIASPVFLVAGSQLYPMSDAAKLVLVGTTLFGLAAAVRKAN